MLLPKKMMPFIWYFIKKQPIAFSIVLASGLVWSLNEMLFPYFLKWIIDLVSAFQGERQFIYSILFYPLSLLAILWLLMEFSMRIQGITLVYLFPRFRANIREEVFNYVKQHSHHYFTENFAGSIAKKLSELPTSCQNVTEIVFFNFIPISLAFIIAFFLMAFTNGLFAIILLVWFLLHTVITRLFINVNNQKWDEHSESVSFLGGKIVDIITNMLTVRLFARSKYEHIYLNISQMDEINKAHKALWSVELMRIFQGLSALLFMAITIVTLIQGWIKGWVTLGDFSLIGTLAFWILTMIWYMSYQLLIYLRESASIIEALNLVTTGHDIIDQPHAPRLAVTHAKIIFKQVTFGYQPGKKIFDNLSVTLYPGQKVGLVGFSGSGKSTFVNLLLRFYDIDEGQILIDQQNIAEITQDSLREQIAMIPQDPSLFHRSLKENIRYGNLSASDEEIIEVAKLAHCHEFITSLPEGYDTLVGERGTKLSGGQRQRIAIARAILKNAPILILDEATSALDSVTEKLIQQSLHQLMENRTTLVIAHRLSTLINMDRILVFDKGKIIEDGAIKELLDLKGHFAKLWQMQQNGFLPERSVLIPREVPIVEE
jgi:ATP-binding cassette subfamily B protein